MAVTATPHSRSLLEVIRQYGYFYRHIAISTLLCGTYIHITRLVFGDELLLRYLVTPKFDHALSVLITYCALAGLASWKQMRFMSRAHKIFSGVVLGYFTISIPLHIVTYFTNSTKTLTAVPKWWSVFLMAYYPAAIVSLWRTRISSDVR